MARLKTIEWTGKAVRLIDQTLLPGKLVYEDITNVKDMHHAIKVLKVRGAPAIGIAAAYGLYLAASDFPDDRTSSDFLAYIEKNERYLAGSRPTAVNLFWALNRVKNHAHILADSKTVPEIKVSMLEQAHAILAEDREMGKKIGEHGYELLKQHTNILTHCNAGGLATAEYGTALAPIYVGAESGTAFHVYADETRPLLQGARITAFELQHAGIAVTLLCDNSAAFLMKRGLIDAVVVGADRIAANGDTANKIGTYSVALAAKAHSIPFYVAAPSSTFDPAIASGEDIPIEERDAEEVTEGFGRRTAPQGIDVLNYAFDVTPHELIWGIITEKGALTAPLSESINTVRTS
ncbi:MAG: S-methyl-5-thioribose-1-phosphate isomerase [Chitinivibrionales bacterium]|nr:S-methyl-5-thioribose-1-phosphate isomerase [Chitinivibrionales bacterium]